MQQNGRWIARTARVHRLSVVGPKLLVSARSQQIEFLLFNVYFCFGVCLEFKLMSCVMFLLGQSKQTESRTVTC